MQYTPKDMLHKLISSAIHVTRWMHTRVFESSTFGLLGAHKKLFNFSMVNRGYFNIRVCLFGYYHVTYTQIPYKWKHQSVMFNVDTTDLGKKIEILMRNQ